MPLVDRLPQPDAVRSILRLFAPLDAKLARLASVAVEAGGNQAAAELADLQHLQRFFAAILTTLILCSFLLIGLIAHDNRQFGRSRISLLTLTGRLQRTASELGSTLQLAGTANQDLEVQNRILQERENTLNVQYERFGAALNNMSQALCMCDSEDRLIVCNRRFLEIFGLTHGIARPGAPMHDVRRAMRSIGALSPALIEAIQQQQTHLIDHDQAGDFVVEDHDGAALAITHRPMPAGGWVATYEDVHERRQTEAQLKHMAYHDALTDLPNRMLLREAIHQSVGMLAHRTGSLAILYLDVDNFKEVNDALGHTIGDMLLEAMSHRLKNCLRQDDMIARLGGDEFAVVHFQREHPDQTAMLARRIIQTISAPYLLNNQRVVVSASIGVSVAPADGTDVDLLLRNADMALYRAKADGRGTFRFFEPEMDAQVQARRNIEVDLRDALACGQIAVFYQPMLNIEENRITSYEALMRWRHPTDGIIPPAQFIPIAEETGLISALGQWVLHQACQDAIRWPDAIRLAVNVSAVQFVNSDVVQVVADALARSGLSPNRLELEITEAVLLKDRAGVLQVLNALHASGVRIVLDDFGTGYSSLAHLRSFAFDKIKIDQSFIRDIAIRPDCFAIVRSVATLARELGMTPVAEGVESGEQIELLRQASCSEVQGYCIDRPKQFDDLTHTASVTQLSEAALAPFRTSA